jgi:hypothetical protein
MFVIMGESTGCIPCVTFIFSRFAGLLSFDTVVNRCVDEETTAIPSPEVMQLRIVETVENALAFSAAGRHVTVSGRQTAEVKAEFYVKAAGLSGADVVKIYGKQPKCLKMKAYFVPQPGRPLKFYPVFDKALRAQFPTVKIGCSWSAGVGMSSAEASSSFKGQAQLMLDSVATKDLESDELLEKGVEEDDVELSSMPLLTLESFVPTDAVVKMKVAMLDERIARKKQRRVAKGEGVSLSLSRADASDESEGDASLYCCSEPEDSCRDENDCPEQTCAGEAHQQADEVRPPSKVEKSSRQPSSSPQPMKRSKKSPDSIEEEFAEEVNPHAFGSMQYWSFELKFRFAYDGEKQGHAHRQIALLMPKLPENEQTTMTLRKALMSNALKLSKGMSKKHDDDTIMEVWKPLKEAGEYPTQSARLGLHERYVNNLWAKAEETQDTSELPALFKRLLAANAPWAAPRGQDDFDPLVTHLHKLLIPAKQLPQIFTTCVFSGTFSRWFAEGSPRAEWVTAMCVEADEFLFSMPEDADIDDDMVPVMVEAQSAVGFVHLLRLGSIENTTDFKLLDTLPLVAKEIVRTTGPASPLQIISQAVTHVKNGFWDKKYCFMKEHKVALEQHGPKVANAIQKVKDIICPCSEEGFRLLCSLLKTEVHVWDASIYNGATTTLRIEIQKACSTICEDIGRRLADKPSQPDINRPLATELSSTAELLKECSKMFPVDDLFRRTITQVKEALGSVDFSDKVGVIRESGRAWQLNDETSTAKLQQSFQFVKASSIPVDVCGDMLLALQRGLEAVEQMPELRNLPKRGIEGLELLAANVGKADASSSTQIVLWIKNAQKMETHAWNLRQAQSPDNPDQVSDSQRDTFCRELLQSCQRVDNARPTETGFNNLKNMIDKSLAESKDLVTATAKTIRQVPLEAAIKSEEELSKLISGDPGIKSWTDDASGAASLDELVEVFLKGFASTDTGTIKTVAESVEKNYKIADDKTLDFGIDKLPPSATRAGLLHQAHVLCFEKAVIAHFSKLENRKDKVGTRERMKECQADMREWKLGPKDIQPVLLSEYRSGIKISR